MPVASARRAKPSAVARARVKHVRRMTQPPRKRGESTPSALDLQRNFDKLGQMIQGSEERVGDKLARVEAKGDARQEVNVKAQAEAAARMDALTQAQARTDRRSEEILASSTRGYQTLEKAQRETKESLELRVQSLEERAVPAAAEIAEHTVEKLDKAGQRRSNRQTGLTMGAIGVGLGTLCMGVINFAASHMDLMLRIVHVVSLGLVKVTATPHE